MEEQPSFNSLVRPLLAAVESRLQSNKPSAEVTTRVATTSHGKKSSMTVGVNDEALQTLMQHMKLLQAQLLLECEAKHLVFEELEAWRHRVADRDRAGREAIEKERRLRQDLERRVAVLEQQAVTAIEMARLLQQPAEKKINATDSSGGEETDESSLDDIAPVIPSRPNSISFEDRLKQLKAYKKKYGDLFIKFDYQGYNNLGGFVYRLRQRNNGVRKPGLSKKETAELDAIGFEWDGTRTIPFEERLVELAVYKEQHGDLLVPFAYRKQSKLGHYVGNLRSRGRRTLSKAQIAQLDALGFVWCAGRKRKVYRP